MEIPPHMQKLWDSSYFLGSALGKAAVAARKTNKRLLEDVDDLRPEKKLNQEVDEEANLEVDAEAVMVQEEAKRLVKKVAKEVPEEEEEDELSSEGWYDCTIHDVIAHVIYTHVYTNIQCTHPYIII